MSARADLPRVPTLHGLAGSSMRPLSKRWGIVFAVITILVAAFLMLSRHTPATANAIEMTFVGYTNAPNNNSRFALFSLSNIAGYDVRCWGDWVEVEGDSNLRAEVVNPALPGFTRGPVLKAGGSLVLAVGVPFYAPETGRWRFSTSFTRYSVGLRWLDFSSRHHLPLKVGPIAIVDDQRILDKTNQVIVSSIWLTD